MDIQFVTYSTDPLDQALIQLSANEHNIELKTLLCMDPWKSHWQKISTLEAYLQNVEDEVMICYLDAYDTIFNKNANDVLKDFYSYETDILFGAEANYSMSIKAQKAKHLLAYADLHPLYNYLNAGTFMGKKKHLMTLFSDVRKTYKISLNDPDTLASGEDDQSYFSRFFVSALKGQINSSIKLMIDTRQLIFGCTGGRMLAKNWQFENHGLEFIYYKKERSILKRRNKLRLQKKFIDYKFHNNRFVNLQTQTTPFIIHSPGSGENFKEIISFNRLNSLTKHTFQDGMLLAKAWLKTKLKMFQLGRKHRNCKGKVWKYYYHK